MRLQRLLKARNGQNVGSMSQMPVCVCVCVYRKSPQISPPFLSSMYTFTGELKLQYQPRHVDKLYLQQTPTTFTWLLAWNYWWAYSGVKVLQQNLGLEKGVGLFAGTYGMCGCVWL